jgi:hypothetical protein
MQASALESHPQTRLRANHSCPTGSCCTKTAANWKSERAINSGSPLKPDTCFGFAEPPALQWGVCLSG